MTFVQRIRSTDRRLGRHVHHDPRSLNFPAEVTINQATWRNHRVRIYDPTPNPNQIIGDCTGCAKAMQFNSAGNRVDGKVLNLADADRVYSLATSLDPYPGSYPPKDTGSDALSAAKAAQELGLGGTYTWVFGGADGVVQAVMDSHVVNVGTRWDNNMFNPDSSRVIHLGGGVAGGHEYTIRGYDLDTDRLLGRCWWGAMRDWWIARTDLAELLADNGDALLQERTP